MRIDFILTKKLIRLILFTTIAVFIAVYTWWFRVSPESGMFYAGGLLLILYTTSSISVFHRTQARLKKLPVFFVISIFAANCYYVLTFKPEVLDAIEFNNTRYYLTWNVEFFIEGSHLQFTKWQGINYETRILVYDKYLPYTARFFIDPTSNEVSVINTSSDNELTYTDGTLPRRYEPYPVELVNHRYYASIRYIETTACEDGWFRCAIVEYTLYECNRDNTSCRVLPFRYVGERDYTRLETDESKMEVNVYLDPHPFDHPILIYTYGENPRCYVENCEILEQK